MADCRHLDPWLVRLVWALLILAGGVGLLLYIIAAIVIPEEPVGFAGTATAGASAPQGADAAAPAGANPAGAAADDWHARREARRAARAQRMGNGGGAILLRALPVGTGA